jgi:DNA invertase Pin-like site-specific DNA recombinase
MRVAIYARVSTTDQNCAMQLTELRRYARARGWQIAGEYVDAGWSGAKASRPELDRLMGDARLRNVDCILVWKLDRWGRSVSNLLASLQELAGLGVRWIAVTQNLDTDEANPVGRLLLHILASVAEFERSMIQERVRAGLAAAQARGVHCGRPRKVFHRGRAVELRAKGLSWRAISRELQVPQITIRRAVAAQASTPRQSRVPKVPQEVAKTVKVTKH